MGLHLAITSEWDGIKWRPLTVCPSLVDADGYFLPMIGPNKNYPGLAITENQWKLEEVEQEFRAQIELALKHVPQINHLSGHMGSTGFHPDVAKMASRLAAEYNLLLISRDLMQELAVFGVTYNGPKATSKEKEASFIRMLENLEAGKSYQFVDHPAYDNMEMQGVSHIGYEDVAVDRQGVTDTWTSEKVKEAVKNNGIELVNFSTIAKDSDWLQGYGYQLCQSRHNSYRADGRSGQFILMLPEKNAVIVTTADIPNMQAELNLIWDHLLPAFEE